MQGEELKRPIMCRFCDGTLISTLKGPYCFGSGGPSVMPRYPGDETPRTPGRRFKSSI